MPSRATRWSSISSTVSHGKCSSKPKRTASPRQKSYTGRDSPAGATACCDGRWIAVQPKPSERHARSVHAAPGRMKSASWAVGVFRCSTATTRSWLRIPAWMRCMLANPIRVLLPRVKNALTGYGSPVAIARNVSVGLAM